MSNSIPVLPQNAIYYSILDLLAIRLCVEVSKERVHMPVFIPI